MKIFEIGTGYTPIPAQMGAATEIVVEELTRSLLKLGQKAEIIDIKTDDRAPFDLPILEVQVPGILTKKDVTLGIAHKIKRVVYSIALARKLKKILKASAEKVVLHFHNQYNLFFFLKLTSKKLREKAVIAYTVHSYIWGAEWAAIEETVRKKYFQEIFCVRNADAVFVLNDITIAHFADRLGVKKERIHKVINGVNIEKYTPLDASVIQAFKSENNLDGKKIIFQVGSVCDRKNQLGTVEMLAEYLQANPNVVYLYAGGVIDGEYQQKILKLAEERNIAAQVRYLGELSPGEQLSRYYNIADCSVFTSKQESFGLVIIEAIAAGTPVVLGGEPMFDLKSGYCTYQNEIDFVDRVDQLLKKKQPAVSAEVLEKYNWDTVAKVHCDRFKEIS